MLKRCVYRPPYISNPSSRPLPANLQSKGTSQNIFTSTPILFKQTEMAIVPSKKMIAICHYGGEFETYEDGLMWYSGGEAYAVDLEVNMQLSGFKQEVAEAIDSTVDGMLVKYFLPGNKKNLITVSKDKDFHRMVNYYKESDQLEVFIMKESSPDKTSKKKPVRRPPKRPAETQVAAVLPPADLGPPNVIPLNEVIGIETANEITPVLDPALVTIRDLAKRFMSSMQQLLESDKVDKVLGNDYFCGSKSLFAGHSF
ncbi:hypothetical protein L1987_39115 [Smallanthus sonchifolius]|uniref:Uncharacterized protein n=1 Tax=Smallanthus sonchifolius TaxID=185202 RepID=A0ACB9HL53_9ASTR|nr:hypothetical protein L1987_39115 [Smallanthus sonchifolius]